MKLKNKIISIFLFSSIILTSLPLQEIKADIDLSKEELKEMHTLSNPKTKKFEGNLQEILSKKAETKEESLEKSEAYYRKAVASDAIRKTQTELEDSVLGKYSSSQYDLSAEEEEEMKKLLETSKNVRPGVDNRSTEFKEEDEENDSKDSNSYREVIEYKPKNIERNDILFRPNYSGPTYDGSVRVSGDWSKYEQEVRAEHSKEEAVNYLWSLEGTTYSQSQRMAPGMYDCSSMVDRVVAYYLGTSPNGMTTFTMPNDSRFYQVPMSEIQPYDILWTNGHVEFYVGGNDTFGAHSWGQPNGLARGNFSYTPWLRVYRIKGWE